KGENAVKEEYLPLGATDAYLVQAIVTDPTRNLRGMSDCPLVSPGPALDISRLVRGNLLASPSDNPFAGLSNVATNKPGIVFLAKEEQRTNGAKPFAKFSQTANLRHTIPVDRVDDYHLVFAAGQDLDRP